MKLKSFNLYCLLIIFLFSTPLKSEDEKDIWKKSNTEEKQSTQINKKIKKEETQKLNSDSIKTIELNQKIEITDGSLKENSQEAKVFGIYDPADNDFDLNMWSSTKAEDIKSSLKRLEKIKLSKTADEILERILMSFAYSPKGMKEDEEGA